MRRRAFLQTAFAAVPAGVLAERSSASAPSAGVRVAAGLDRFRETRTLPGRNPMWVKVATRDTRGAMYVMEQTNARKGGPPRHVHHEQDEWFYVIGGDYIVEAGDERIELSAGDSVLVPRRVAHTWAFAGATPGRLLIAFTPAGNIEAFFREVEKLGGSFGDDRMVRRYGMENVGPPIKID